MADAVRRDTGALNIIETSCTLLNASALLLFRVMDIEACRMLYHLKHDLAVLYAECHMWFTYLADDFSLQSAFDMRKKYTARLARHPTRVGD